MVERSEAEDCEALGVSDCFVEFLDCFGVFFGPFELSVFACECMEWAGFVAVVRDEFAVVSGEAKVTLDFTKGFHGEFPIKDGCHFGGVDLDDSVGDNVSKVFDFTCGEVAFFEFAIPLVVCEACDDTVYVAVVVFNGG